MEELRSRPSSLSPGLLYGDLYSPDGKTPYPRALPEPDVYILTTGGHRIPAHSGILVSASPVLENIIDGPRKHRRSGNLIPMLGVPCEAVAAFIRFIYSSRCTEEEMEKYDIHLLALAHVYRIPQLKRSCIKGLSQRLTVDNVVDVLQLSRLCNAPDLCLRCMRMVYKNSTAVEKTEGWKFLQDHDPHLELEILEFIDEAESRKKRARRHREEQRLYAQLSDAMACLEHICTEGGTGAVPADVCRGLQQLIRHFASCEKRAGGDGIRGCWRCKRMWQLLRLHSFVCDNAESCRVPVCRRFKSMAEVEKRKDDGTWRLLARKVVSARAMASISQTQAKRKRWVEEGRGSLVRSNSVSRIKRF